MMPTNPPLTAGNLLSHLPENLAEEALEVLGEAKNVRIERIISQGHASADTFWYDQPQHELVVLISGAAQLHFEGETEFREMQPGDYLLIPAGRRHRVAWTTPEAPSVWLAVHYGP